MAPASDGEIVWSTCLRDIVFAPAAVPSAGGQAFHDADAYGFLLEVICGLHSPIAGETQVMGQFKAFLAGLGASEATLRTLGQHLLADARKVRETHLIGLGSRSYGSAVRRRLGDHRRIGIIGRGALAQEILPFLDGRTIDHWGRQIDDTAPAIDEPVALIVAAPIDAAGIRRVASRYTAIAQVIDLRGDGARDPVAIDAPVVTLAEIFADVRAAGTNTDRKVRAAKAAIAACAAARHLRADLRPSGWHDLCA